MSDSENNSRKVPPVSVPSDTQMTSDHKQISQQQPSPTLPSGKVMNAKNTLQSIDQPQHPVVTPNNTDHKPAAVALTLPNGETINAKNTLHSFTYHNNE